MVYKINEPNEDLTCNFCDGGPLECDCEDVDVKETFDNIEEALLEAGRIFNLVNNSKISQEEIESLFLELSLDRDDPNSWETIESMSMWL